MLLSVEAPRSQSSAPAARWARRWPLWSVDIWKDILAGAAPFMLGAIGIPVAVALVLIVRDAPRSGAGRDAGRRPPPS